MRGRLPLRYQLMVWLVGLVTMTGTGAWLAWSTPVPLVWTSGAVVGALLGVAAVSAFVHVIGTESEDSPARR